MVRHEENYDPKKHPWGGVHVVWVVGHSGGKPISFWMFICSLFFKTYTCLERVKKLN